MLSDKNLIVNKVQQLALKLSEGQGGLACCSTWGHKESDMTEWQKKKDFFIQTLNIDLLKNTHTIFKKNLFKMYVIVTDKHTGKEHKNL